MSAVLAPRFAEVFCSQCGQCQGAGDAGFSHCRDHRSDSNNRQLDAFERAEDAAYDTAKPALAAITAIKVGLFDERVALLLIDAITRRIDKGQFAHQEHASEASDFLSSAHAVLETVADAQVREQA